MQLVELHYARNTILDHAAVQARAQAILDSDIDASFSDNSLLLFHKAHVVQFSDGSATAQTAILSSSEPTQVEAYAQETQQSWRCPRAQELLRGCNDSRLVAEMMARTLSPQDRIMLFHGVLRAMIESTNPDALVFKHSQQVIEPGEYLAKCDEDPIYRPGSLNVRFFNISNSNGDMLMDTRGLTELGLHDLQCRFRGLDPNGVAGVLFNTSIYIFEKGRVIESGQTVEGVEPGSRWSCEFESSLTEPTREVLDLNPGQPFAAGERKRGEHKGT